MTGRLSSESPFVRIAESLSRFENYLFCFKFRVIISGEE